MEAANEEHTSRPHRNFAESGFDVVGDCISMSNLKSSWIRLVALQVQQVFRVGGAWRGFARRDSAQLEKRHII
jgi:hypothetical protein